MVRSGGGVPVFTSTEISQGEFVCIPRLHRLAVSYSAPEDASDFVSAIQRGAGVGLADVDPEPPQYVDIEGKQILNRWGELHGQSTLSAEESQEKSDLEKFLDIEYDLADPMGYVLDVKLKKGLRFKAPTVWDHLEEA